MKANKKKTIGQMAAQPIKILVVEDEIIIAEDLKRILKEFDYDVGNVALSGKEAIEFAKRENPNLILMDINLNSEINGIEAAIIIRRQFDIPVVFLTAFSDKETIEQAKKSEAFGYLIKPYAPEELKTTIELALYKHSMEKKLRENEEWLRATLSSIGDGVIAVDTNERVLFINPVVEELTGWTKKESQGQSAEKVFNIVSENSRYSVKSPLKEALAKGEFTYLREPTLLIKRTGESIPIDDCAAPIRNQHNEVIGAVLVFRDITTQKELEEQLLQARKMEAIGRLTAGIAHDFNNMMAAVIGHGSLLLKRMDENDSNIKAVKAIVQAGEKAAALTKHLMAFGRKQMLRPKLLCLSQYVAEFVILFQKIVGDHIAFDLKLCTDLPLVKADPVQIEQVVMNLVINARDAMPSGGIITIATDKIEFDETATKRFTDLSPGQYVRLTVSDTGAGMDQQTLKHIFEPYFTTKTFGAGSGMGLSTTYGIIKQSGGEIEVHSEVGRGSDFNIYLPTCLDEDALVSELPELFSGKAKFSGSVMLVEDESAVREAVKSILEIFGFTVITAENGYDALTALENGGTEIDLILSDVTMPKMGGHQLVQQLKLKYPNMKILLMSGYHSGDASESYDERIPLIQKPFTLKELSSQLQILMEN